jgi:FkbM family methyltransferase
MLEQPMIPGKKAKSKVIVFGIGQFFHTLKDDLFETHDVVALMDNDEQKQGVLVNGTEVVHPGEIRNYAFDSVIITIILHQEQVVRQLLGLGVRKEKIVLAANFLMKNDEGNLYEYYIDDQSGISLRYTVTKGTIVPVEKNNFTFLVPSHDAVIASSLINSGAFSQKELDAFFGLAGTYFGARRGVFLDVGANIGTTSLAAAKNDHVSHVIAIEPSSDNFALLQCNIYLNKLHGKIRAIHAAASNSNDPVDLLLSPDSSGDHRVRNSAARAPDSKVERIVAVTIDDVAKDCADDVAFMWIDVQGYEYFVLRGAERLLSRFGKLAVQMEFWPYGLEETNTTELLCRFCKDHFSRYVDVREYLNVQGESVHSISEIDLLPTRYRDTYTDIFLIP